MKNAAAAQIAENQKRLRINEEKWSKTLMDTGWTALPSILLDKQHALGIDSVDLNILLQIAKYWWKRDDLPFPSKKTLATVVGVDLSTIRRRIKRMEDEGLIERKWRFDNAGSQKSNYYSFDGLIAKLKPHAEDQLSLKEKQSSEKQNLLNKKKAAGAKLQLVKSEEPKA